MNRGTKLAGTVAARILAAARAQPRPVPVARAVPASAENMLSEDEVKQHLAAWLEKDGSATYGGPILEAVKCGALALVARRLQSDDSLDGSL